MASQAPRWRRPSAGRRSTVLVAAALAHGLVLLAMWHARASLDRQAPVLVETTLIAAHSPPVQPPAPGLRVSARTPMRARALVAPPVPQAEPSQHAPVAVAPQPPASSASEPLPRLQLTLTPSQLRALEASRPKSLAEAASTPSHTSPFDRLAGDGDGFQETRLPDGSIETHVHGACYVQTQGLAQRLDPIGHAHDVFVGDCRKK